MFKFQRLFKFFLDILDFTVSISPNHRTTIQYSVNSATDQICSHIRLTFKVSFRRSCFTVYNFSIFWILPYRIASGHIQGTYRSTPNLCVPQYSIKSLLLLLLLLFLPNRNHCHNACVTASRMLQDVSCAGCSINTHRHTRTPTLQRYPMLWKKISLQHVTQEAERSTNGQWLVVGLRSCPGSRTSSIWLWR